MANETETKKKEDLESRGVRDTADQIGEQETWMDQVKKLITRISWRLSPRC